MATVEDLFDKYKTLSPEQFEEFLWSFARQSGKTDDEIVNGLGQLNNRLYKARETNNDAQALKDLAVCHKFYSEKKEVAKEIVSAANAEVEAMAAQGKVADAELKNQKKERKVLTGALKLVGLKKLATKFGVKGASTPVTVSGSSSSAAGSASATPAAASSAPASTSPIALAESVEPPKKPKTSMTDKIDHKISPAVVAGLSAGAPEALPFAGLISHGIAKKTSFFMSFLLIIFVILIGGLVLGFLIQYFMLILIFMVVLAAIMFLTSDEIRTEYFTVSGLFILITLLMHYYIVSNKFLAGTSQIILGIIAYLVIGIVYVIITGFEQENITTAITASILSVVVFILPPLLQNNTYVVVPTNILDGVVFFATLLPVWPILMLMRIKEANPDGYASWLLKAITIAVVCIALVGVIYTMLQVGSILPQGDTTGTDAKESVKAFWNTIVLTYNKIEGRVSLQIDQQLNPDKYYRGTVEQNANKKEPLGVQIVSLKPANTQSSNDTPIDIIGAVTATSFIAPSISVTPTCLIDKKDMPAAASVGQLDLISGTTKSYVCTFPPLPTGTYTVKSYVTFPFETWSYIKYTFVDENRALSIASQGKNVVQVLGLGASPEAIYTAGPVMLGMGSDASDHPIIINPAKEQMMHSQIGFTISNSWEVGGKILRINRIELKVPSPFIVKNCSREITETPAPDVREPAYTNYVFENKKMNDRTLWESITCKLDVSPDNRSEIANMFSENDAIPRTFIAVVNYDYSIEKTTTVKVK